MLQYHFRYYYTASLLIVGWILPPWHIFQKITANGNLERPSSLNSRSHIQIIMITTYEKITLLKVLLVLYDVLYAKIILFEDKYPYLRKARWAFPTMKCIYYRRVMMRAGGWSRKMKQGRKWILTPLLSLLHQLHEVSLLISPLRKVQ